MASDPDIDRRIIGLALPALGALAAEPLYRLVDTIIVGRIGTAELGGVAVAVSLISLVVAGSNFLAYGTTQRVAGFLAVADRRAAGDATVNALGLALVIGVVTAPLLALFARPIATLFGATDDVLDAAVTYLRISAIGVPFVVVGLAAQGAQRGASDYRSALVILVSANVVNVVLEVALVFGVGWGVAGAAWSTVASQVGAGIALVMASRGLIMGAGRVRPDLAGVRPLLSAGRHLLLRVASMLAVFTGATSIAARVDDPTLAAHSIATAVFVFLALALDAIGVPAQTLVAEEVGRGGRDAQRVASRTVALSRRVGVCAGAVVVLTSPLLARLFTTDPAVVSRATVALVMLGAVTVPGSIAFATDGALIGAGDYRFLGRAAFGYLVLVAPIAAIVVLTPSFGITGIWTGLLAWMVLRAVVNRRRLRTVLVPRPT